MQLQCSHVCHTSGLLIAKPDITCLAAEPVLTLLCCAGGNAAGCAEGCGALGTQRQLRLLAGRVQLHESATAPWQYGTQRSEHA